LLVTLTQKHTKHSKWCMVVMEDVAYIISSAVKLFF
jgi:hypothetical protein